MVLLHQKYELRIREIDALQANPWDHLKVQWGGETALRWNCLNGPAMYCLTTSYLQLCLPQVLYRWYRWWSCPMTATVLWLYTTNAGWTIASPCWLSEARGSTPYSGRCHLFWAGAAMASRGQGQAAPSPGLQTLPSHMPTSSASSFSAWLCPSWSWSTAIAACFGPSNR